MRMWWVESESLISDSVGTMEWYLYLGCIHLGWSEVGPWMKKCECPAGSGGHGAWDGFSDLLYRPPVEKMCSSGNLSYFWTEGWEALTSLPLRPKDEWPYCSLDPPALFFFSSWWRKSLVLRSPDHIPAAQWPSGGVLEKDDVNTLISWGFRPVLKGS